MQTCVHPLYDAVACSITSSCLPTGRIRVSLRFPYPSFEHTSPGYTWNFDSLHTSQLLTATDHCALFVHSIDTFTYYLMLTWTDTACIVPDSQHTFILQPHTQNTSFSFVAHFLQSLPNELVTLPYTTVYEQNVQSWKSFWQSGGAIDLSHCTDPRALELERRIVLSQYLTRVQCAGLYPPQETGLTYNSWYGKFHLEMMWWHGVHYILWNRSEYLERMLSCYFQFRKYARETAQRHGCMGVRWQKMTSPTGMDSPSSIGAFLIWQQPHIIYITKLLTKKKLDTLILSKYAPLIFETADFMATFATFDSTQHRFILGPPLIPAQECFPAEATYNPPFELAYWKYGLHIAQEWRKSLLLPSVPLWDSVVHYLSRPQTYNGYYLFAENRFDSYSSKFMHDHPMVLGMYGMLPNTGMVDTFTMKRTLLRILEEWDWERTWGWDFPLAAMTATRLHLPHLAIEILLRNSGKNHFLKNGHNYQDSRLRVYLPGNGALLTAVAMMCAGYEGCTIEAPGFPKDGTWNVRWEGLLQLP
ncbi:MAG: hypothetical protein N3A63_03375 [Bacteroidetes bacterium]|nr:hypothetical protein [Bacteroidota bacterium]